MLTLTLSFRKETPFFNNNVTFIGKDLEEISESIDKNFCSSTELQITSTQTTARLNVNKFDYYADCVIANLIE